MPLLETLIAFVVAASALGVLVGELGSGMRSAQVAAHYQDALSRARSHLAAASVSARAGHQEGDDGGGFSWQVVTVPAASGEPGLVLYTLRVTVAWTGDGGRREVTLVTRRLGEGAAPS